MKTENRTFVLSGGSSGLGLATVRDLLAQKAFVSIIDRAIPPIELTLTSNVVFFKTDITNLEEVASAVENTAKWASKTGAPLGGVINCAGSGTAAKIIDANNKPHSLDVWNFTLAVNLTGAFNLTRLVLQHLLKVDPETGRDGERGVVIFVASSAAFEGQQGQIAYSASKGALVSMTIPMARDLARHAIRVVTIAPGVFDSNMTTDFPDKLRHNLAEAIAYPKRFGQPEEFARTVRWILDCPFVNGETIRITGGGRLPGKL